jgi:beta-N-acetylhexosaminidase
MEGARHLEGRPLSYVDAAQRALQAGCDMVLMCNQSQVDGGRALDELLDGLWNRQADGRWTPEIDSEARRLALLPQTAPWTWDELMREPVYQQALNLLT